MTQINLRNFIFLIIQDKKKLLEIQENYVKNIKFTLECLDKIFNEDLESLKEEDQQEMIKLLRESL